MPTEENCGCSGGRRAVIIIANGGTFLGLDMYKRIVEIALRDKIIVYVVDACPGRVRTAHGDPISNVAENQLSSTGSGSGGFD